MDDGVENTSTERVKLVTDFISFLNNEVKWRYSQKFYFAGDESTMVDGKLAKLDNYMVNADIASFLGKYVFDSSPSEVMNDEEIMDEIFENPKNKCVASNFFGMFWNTWTCEDI